MDKDKLGKKAEDITLRELEDRGYQLLDRNWQFGHKELDLVMLDGDELVVVEVKSLRSVVYGNPIDHVNQKKERNIIDAADAYIIEKDLNNPVRFDVVEVVFSGEEYIINHIPGAFTPLF
ncbi:MAG: YraN family protein [Bacteroidales bacterium]